MIASFWVGIGFRFVIFLAGLQNVDIDLMDAAAVDGANAWQRFWNVIIPQLSHVITLVVTLALLGSFKIFDIVYSMTGGGPGNSTELIGTYTYRRAFAESRVGYGAALAVLTTILALVLSAIFIRVRERGEA
jgi:ABC-type sugar transport system permease subunit